MSDELKWYVVHTYSGYENSVASAVLTAAEKRKMQDLITETQIPMETVTERTDKGKKTYERKIMPGYVLIKMQLTDESWHLVRNVRGVTGFVGAAGKAIPLTDEESLAMGVERHEVLLGFGVGDAVRVMEGPLEGVSGIVEGMDPDKDLVKVRVSMFGRETPVDLSISQIEKSKKD
ncbi:MAG: transcription termination/antitermination factor NusG [Clostridiaceae bacterium]|nr:transcription termination/antitermination factor NusG [Clostridiaceae bacterium]